MKAHHNEGFYSDLMIYFWLITLLKLVASFLRQKVAYFYEQSSRHVSSAVGAYWNPWVHWNSTFFPGSSFQLGKMMCVTIEMHTLFLTDPFNQWNCWDTLCCILGSTWRMSSLYPPLPRSRNGGRKILYIVEKDKKDKLFKLLLFRKNVSVCFHLDIWSELFHGYPKLSPLTTLGNCLQC